MLSLRRWSSLRCFWVATTVLLSFPAYGGSFSHGGDLASDRDNPWFADSEPVYYCVKFDHYKPFPESTVNRIVQESIRDWQDFFRRYGMDRPQGETAAKINTDLRPDCSRGVADIEFVFVSHTSSAFDPVQSGGQIYPSRLALVTRRDFDYRTMRSGGSVVVSDAMREEQKLKHIVLHELGHVFGMKENSVFVMDSMTMERLINNVPDLAYGKIESPHWKYKLRLGDEIDFSYNRTCYSSRTNTKLKGFLTVHAFDHNQLYYDLFLGSTQKIKATIGDRNCVAVRMQVTYQMAGISEYTLRFVTEDGLFWSATGTFHEDPVYRGPTLFKMDVSGNPNSPFPRVMYQKLDQGDFGLPGRGFLAARVSRHDGSDAKEKAYGATLQYERGPVLSIFSSNDFVLASGNSPVWSTLDGWFGEPKLPDPHP